MSFGFSVGDFVTLSTVAFNIYDSLKSSPSEFKSITSEANTLSLILKSIASHLSNHTVDPESAKELESLCRQTSKVLEDIRELLERFGSLGERKPRKLHRIKWALKGGSAEVRNKLLFHAGVLNYLNTSLTKLSHDRLEQNLAMLLKRVTDDATTPPHNPSNKGAVQQPPILHNPLPLRVARFPDASPGSTPETPDVLPTESEKPATQPNNSEDADLPLHNSSELQNHIPVAAERKVNRPEGQGPLTHFGSCYQRMIASGNSIQINGDIGKSELWPRRSNTYADMAASGNSIQFNGDVLDPAILFNAVKC